MALFSHLIRLLSKSAALKITNMPLCVYMLLLTEEINIPSAHHRIPSCCKDDNKNSFFLISFFCISRENLKVCNFKCVYTFPSLHLCYSILLLYSLIRCNLCTLRRRKKVYKCIFHFFMLFSFSETHFCENWKVCHHQHITTLHMSQYLCMNFCIENFREKKFTQIDSNGFATFFLSNLRKRSKIWEKKSLRQGLKGF